MLKGDDGYNNDEDSSVYQNGDDIMKLIQCYLWQWERSTLNIKRVYYF